MNDPGASRVGFLLGEYPWPVRSGGNRRDAPHVDFFRRRTSIALAGFVDDEERAAEARSDPACVAVEQLRGGRFVKSRERLAVSLTASGITRQHPAIAARTRSARRLTSAIVSLPVDVIVARSCFASLLFGDPALLGRPVVLDAVDAEDRAVEETLSTLPRLRRQLLRQTVLRALRRSMRAGYPKAAEIWVSTNEDAEYIREAIPAASVLVVPNTIALPAARRGGADRCDPVVLFVGNTSHVPNREAMQEIESEIFPLVRRGMPSATLRLIGRAPQQSDRQRGISASEYMPSLIAEYAAARLVLAPIRAGAGTKSKIIEALAYGVPVVATPKAVEGIAVHEGSSFLAGQSPRQLADASIAVLTDDSLAERVGTAGREVVRSSHSIDALESALSRSAISQVSALCSAEVSPA